MKLIMGFFCEQVNANAQQRFDTEIEIIDNQGMKESDPSFSVDEEEKVKIKMRQFYNQQLLKLIL